jgi:hypothetical protein
MSLNLARNGHATALRDVRSPGQRGKRLLGLSFPLLTRSGFHAHLYFGSFVVALRESRGLALSAPNSFSGLLGVHTKVFVSLSEMEVNC